MTAAPTLPERQEWTVDDLGELPRDLRYCPEDQHYVSRDSSLRIDRRSEPRPDIVVIVPDHNTTSPFRSGTRSSPSK